MKNILCLLLLFCTTAKCIAQEISGRWYSADSTRIYEVTPSGNDQWKAVILASSRKNDKVGFEVARQIIFNKQKKRFEGYLYSTDNDEPAFVKISFDKTNINEIKLKLDRMFLFDVTVKWLRANTAAAVKQTSGTN